MPSILLYLLSLDWAYVNTKDIEGWFASKNGKPQYSFYYDKQLEAAAMVQWSNHPRERVPLALVLDRNGIRVQQQELRPLNPLTETQQ